MYQLEMDSPREVYLLWDGDGGILFPTTRLTGKIYPPSGSRGWEYGVAFPVSVPHGDPQLAYHHLKSAINLNTYLKFVSIVQSSR